MITILMPIYNGIEFIDESVSSIINQTYQEWELIIGINGHPVNSEVYKKAKEYENDKIRVFDFYTIKGKSDTLNEMVKYAKYDWIALLDVDDKWLPTKLEKQIPYLSNYDIIGTMCQYFGDKNIIISLPLNNVSEYNFYNVNPIINSSAFIKKDLCFWDKKWNGIEDYDLWLRLWKKNYKFYNVPSIEVLHRIHKQSAFNSKGNNNDVPALLKWHRNH